MNSKRNERLFFFDIDRLNDAIARKGYSGTELATLADVSRSTVSNARKGEGLRPQGAKGIAKALGFDDPTGLSRDHAVTDGTVVEVEWEAEGKPVSGTITASNALQYQVWKMRHLFVDGRYGRGKCFDLLNPNTRDREHLHDQLVRHSRVSDMIRSMSYVTRNLSSYESGDRRHWWTVDEWIDGETLKDRIHDNRVSQDEAQRWAIQMALGLGVLHEANVVVRDLFPKHILVAAEDNRVVITDFELAKLFDAGPSVATDWEEDPYRAPEIETGHVTVRGDLYCWARIVLELFSNKLPPKNEEPSELKSLPVPKSVRDLLKRCLRRGSGGRPKDVGEILSVMQHEWPEVYKECDRG